MRETMLTEFASRESSGPGFWTAGILKRLNQIVDNGVVMDRKQMLIGVLLNKDTNRPPIPPASATPFDVNSPCPQPLVLS